MLRNGRWRHKISFDDHIVNNLFSRSKRGSTIQNLYSRSSLHYNFESRIDLLGREPFDFRILLFELAIQGVGNDAIGCLLLALLEGVSRIVIVSVNSQSLQQSHALYLDLGNCLFVGEFEDDLRTQRVHGLDALQLVVGLQSHQPLLPGDVEDILLDERFHAVYGGFQSGPRKYYLGRFLAQSCSLVDFIETFAPVAGWLLGQFEWDVGSRHLVAGKFGDFLVLDHLVDLQIVGVQLHTQEVLIRVVDLIHKFLQALFVGRVGIWLDDGGGRGFFLLVFQFEELLVDDGGLGLVGLGKEGAAESELHDAGQPSSQVEILLQHKYNYDLQSCSPPQNPHEGGPLRDGLVHPQRVQVLRRFQWTDVLRRRGQQELHCDHPRRQIHPQVLPGNAAHQ